LEAPSEIDVPSADCGPTPGHSKATRIAVLSRHNLSSLEPGEKVHVYNKIIALAKQASVILFTPYWYASRRMQSQMKVIQVSRPGLPFFLVLPLVLFVHRSDYDCIYSRDILLVALATPMKALGKSLIVELNGIPSLEAESEREARKVRQPKLTPLICGLIQMTEAFAIRCADLVLAVTQKIKTVCVRNYRADPRRVAVLPNMVDTTVFRSIANEREEIRRGFGIGDEMVVLYVSSFSARWRRSENLFQIAHSIQRKRSDVVFLTVGPKPTFEGVKMKIGAETSNRILFAGAVDPRLVPAFFSAADIYVHDVIRNAGAQAKLIEREGLCPTKILESMSCSRPVIAPKESELESMLRRSNGGFCAASMEEVETFIEKFADSPNLVKSMGTDARRYVELNHDATRLTKSKVELIGRIVSSRVN